MKNLGSEKIFSDIHRGDEKIYGRIMGKHRLSNSTRIDRPELAQASLSN